MSVAVSQTVETRFGKALTSVEWRIGEFDEHDVTSEVRIVERRAPRGVRRFAVVCRGWVLAKNGDWELEPTPSSRTDAFFDRCRFTDFDDAYHHALRAEVP